MQIDEGNLQDHLTIRHLGDSLFLQKFIFTIFIVHRLIIYRFIIYRLPHTFAPIPTTILRSPYKGTTY